MTRFEIGNKYYCISVCDQNCRWEYAVTKRTEKSIWIGENRFQIATDGESEYIYPLGKYSMAPVLRSIRKVL